MDIFGVISLLGGLALFLYGMSVLGSGLERTSGEMCIRDSGYSAKRGAWGASGMRLSPGYVATNPNEIPYGTKMYIASPDGSFVYGYAIAADTGTGLMQDVIDVDLFYDTYTESCLSSHRIVNIYILD